MTTADPTSNLDHDDIVEALRATSLFADSAPSVLESLASISQLSRHPGGATVVVEGDDATAVFVVVAGRLAVAVSGMDRPVALLQRGDVFGEVSLVDEGARSATVTAQRDAVLVELPTTETRKLLAQAPDELLRLTGVLAQRLRQAHEPVARCRPPRLVGLLGDPDLVAQVSEALATTLAAVGYRVAQVTAPSVVAPPTQLEVPGSDVPLGDAPLDTAPLASPEGIDEQANDVTLIRSSSRPVAVDLLLHVRDGADTEQQDGGTATAAAVLATAAAGTTAIDLTIGAAGPSARASAAAASVTDDRLSLRVDLDDPASLSRLVRLLFGGAVAVVLSGGGWRAAAHLGALEVLAEAGIDADLFVGVSAGSAIAAAAAGGFDRHELTSMLGEMNDNVRWRRDVGPTGQAITTGRSLTRACQTVFGEISLESLAKPCLIVTASLVSRSARVIHRGPAWKAVRASASIPGVVPPVRFDDDVLVDAGVIDNLPHDLVHRYFPDAKVIAIDVGSVSPVDPELFDPSGIAERRKLSNERQLLRLIIGTCFGMRSGAPGRPDLLIRPEVDGIDLFDSGAAQRAITLGAAAARAALAADPLWAAD